MSKHIEALLDKECSRCECPIFSEEEARDHWEWCCEQEDNNLDYDDLIDYACGQAPMFCDACEHHVSDEHD